jgi:hypothetical protein
MGVMFNKADHVVERSVSIAESFFPKSRSDCLLSFCRNVDFIDKEDKESYFKYQVRKEDETFVLLQRSMFEHLVKA